MSISKTEVERIATEAAQKAVDGTFTRLGFDTEDPHESQELMVMLKKIVNSEAIQGLMQSGLTAADFRILKDLCSEKDPVKTLHAAYENQTYKKGLWNKVSGGVILGAVMAALGYIGGLFSNGGGGFPLN